MEQLKNTPLLSRHQRLNALLAPFGGWNMPIQYEGILAEHRWCREKAALFDICHMGEFFYKGDIVAGGLDEVFTFSVSTIPVGRSRYGFLLNERGGVIDDLIVFRLAEDEAMVVVNAATIANDFTVIQSRLRDGELIRDISDDIGKLDVQGPLAREVMTRLLGPEVGEIPYFKFIRKSILGEEAIVSRTGYTGELGYEIFLPSDRVMKLWDQFLEDDRVRPAGLGARDVLRLEVGYSLYGSDIDEDTTPFEAGLDAFVNLDKSFVGKDALLRSKAAEAKKVKIAFQVNSRRSPRHHYDICFEGATIGSVTSGVFSPMLGCGIGIGFVKPGLTAMGAPLTISHGNVSMEATVTELPFYKGGSLRS
jgi:aminomethyltransferase